MYHKALYIVLQIIVGVMLPLAGWLADVRFRRYKVIHCSMWIMWFSVLFLACGEVVLWLLNSDLEVNYHGILLILLFPLGVGFGGFQTNIIQFGVNQLIGASSSEIMTFVMWFSWALNSCYDRHIHE